MGDEELRAVLGDGGDHAGPPACGDEARSPNDGVRRSLPSRRKATIVTPALRDRILSGYLLRIGEHAATGRPYTARVPSGSCPAASSWWSMSSGARTRSTSAIQFDNGGEPPRSQMRHVNVIIRGGGRSSVVVATSPGEHSLIVDSTASEPVSVEAIGPRPETARRRRVPLELLRQHRPESPVRDSTAALVRDGQTRPGGPAGLRVEAAPLSPFSWGEYRRRLH